jgi:hypothetical protein
MIADERSRVVTVRCLAHTSHWRIYAVDAFRSAALRTQPPRSSLQVRTRRWPHLNFLEVNNVCDGGGDLWNALQEVYYA